MGSFIQQATDGCSLAAMMAGGMAYRLGRVGALAAGTGRLASVGIGLGAEVSAFELMNRSLTSLTGEGRLNPNLWRWEGSGGIHRGLLSSLITFGSLKGAGRLAQGENMVVQHLLQDTGMVLGHQASGMLGITSRPTGTLVEQFLHAEATNLQLGAGMALAHGVAPGVQGLERGLDMWLRSKEEKAPPQDLLNPLLQPARLGLASHSWESGQREDPKQEGIFLSSSPKEPFFPIPPRAPVDKFGQGPEAPVEKALREGLVVPPESLGEVIRFILEQIPSAASQVEISTEGSGFPPDMIIQGRLRYRRLEALHRLLSGGKNLAELRVVDNAPGQIMDTAVTIARLGSSVVVKEPGDVESEMNQDILRFLPSPEIKNRIALTAATEIDLLTPSDVVYWTNPCFARLQYPADEVPLADYLGRDVKPGGYLVIQSDHFKGTQRELLVLNLDPRHWETIFDEDLPFRHPGPNFLLPTFQAQNNIHLQIHRRRMNPSVSSRHERKNSLSTPAMNHVDFPYQEGKGGGLLPQKPGSTVAILGDMTGRRIFQLASQGYPVIYMDYDPGYLIDTEISVESYLATAREQGRILREGKVTYLAQNWFYTPLQADHVEVFYPWDFKELPDDGLERKAALRFFLERALNSKLKPGGTGFVVSEHWEDIADLGEVILEDPRLELLERVYEKKVPPIAGGYGFASYSSMLSSWIVYRRK